MQQVENNTVALAQYGLQDAPEYSLGVWCCDELGVYRVGESGQDIVACPHIIFPLRRLVNAYTGVEKIEAVSYTHLHVIRLRGIEDIIPYPPTSGKEWRIFCEIRKNKRRKGIK